MIAIIENLNPGSVIQIPNEEQIVFVKLPMIGLCMSVLYRNMMTWIEVHPFLKALDFYYQYANDEERLHKILGKTILITKRVAKYYRPKSRRIE